MDTVVSRDTLQATLEAIVSPRDTELEAFVSSRLDRLTKPKGSLGRLEEMALWYARARGERLPEAPHPALCVFCADHGVAAEGVSAYPAEVTRQMVLNFAQGGAAINVLCRHIGIEATIVDIGVDSEPFDLPVRNEKVARGTRNMLVEPAMSTQQALRCLETGARLAGEAVDAGATLLAAGDMGIGNTTAAAAVAAALAGVQPIDIVGHGTGLDTVGWRKKVQVINNVVSLRRPDPNDPIDVLAKVGGFEIAAMAGYYLGAAARRTPAVVDGFIAGAAALAAMRLNAKLSHYLLWSHESAERGHRRLLGAVPAAPLFQFGLRLGEGSGAALAMGTVAQAVALYREMATFEAANVTNA